MREATATVRDRGAENRTLRRARDESGVSMVEIALMVTLLFSLLFGIIDFGYLFSQNVTLRNATQQAGRFAAVGDFGEDTVCALEGDVPEAPATRAVMCLVKAEAGVDEGALRVKVALPEGYDRGEPLLLCSEYAASSVSGFFGFLIDDKVLHAKTRQRIEQVVDPEDGELVAAAEQSHDDWSWCA